MRLKSGIWVAAYIRRAQIEGAQAVLRRRGADEAGAGPKTSAVPSSRDTLMKTAPASSAPRRRNIACAPSVCARRM